MVTKLQEFTLIVYIVKYVYILYKKKDRVNRAIFFVTFVTLISAPSSVVRGSRTLLSQ